MQHFPFFSHRTMAEVAETEALLSERRLGALKWPSAGTKMIRLYRLIGRANINNPPPDPTAGPPPSAA